MGRLSGWTKRKTMKKIIGITKPDSDEKHELYVNWITGNDPNIQTITLSADLCNQQEIDKCDALILTGGVDVFPEYYRNNRKDYPGSPEVFNKKRDEFEIEVFNLSREKNIPILAICRGMQLVNCILKGDLVQDLHESGKENHSQVNDLDILHEIKVENNTLLYSIAGTSVGSVNSAHHQAVNKISDELLISAQSLDGVAEATEYKDKKGKPFLLCVQWHPERLVENQRTLPFSKNIRASFLASIKK
jgi:putative glutamine amidotransferase